MAVKSTQRIATLYLTHKTQHKGYQFIYRNRERKTQRRSVTHGSKKWSQATANKSLRLVRGHDVAQKWPFFYISFRTLLHIPHTSVHPSATLHSRTNCSMRFSILHRRDEDHAPHSSTISVHQVHAVHRDLLRELYILRRLCCRQCLLNVQHKKNCIIQCFLFITYSTANILANTIRNVSRIVLLLLLLFGLLLLLLFGLVIGLRSFQR